MRLPKLKPRRREVTDDDFGSAYLKLNREWIKDNEEKLIHIMVCYDLYQKELEYAKKARDALKVLNKTLEVK